MSIAVAPKPVYKMPLEYSSVVGEINSSLKWSIPQPKHEVENIIKNSIDAIKGDGDILVKLSEQKNVIVLTITDNGTGIKKSQFKKIFNPGYTSKKRGWGLGLSLSKRIIEDYHNGKIFVKHSRECDQFL